MRWLRPSETYSKTCLLDTSIKRLILFLRGREPLPLKRKGMKKELKELLNEFIERDFDLDEIDDVIGSLYDLQAQKRFMNDPKRNELRDMDYTDYDILLGFARVALAKYSLEYDPEDLII